MLVEDTLHFRFSPYHVRIVKKLFSTCSGRYSLYPHVVINSKLVEYNLLNFNSLFQFARQQYYTRRARGNRVTHTTTNAPASRCVRFPVSNVRRGRQTGERATTGSGEKIKRTTRRYGRTSANGGKQKPRKPTPPDATYRRILFAPSTAARATGAR